MDDPNGWAEPPQPPRLVRTYGSTRRFRREAEALLADGWVPAEIGRDAPNPGAVRLQLLRFWALLLPPRPVIVVTYRRLRPGEPAALRIPPAPWWRFWRDPLASPPPLTLGDGLLPFRRDDPDA